MNEKDKKKESEILTGHVNSNGNLIGVIDGPFCGCDCVAVRLNVLSPRICVAAAPNVQDVVKSTAAWYSLRQIRNRVLQLPWHDSFGSSFSLQHRPALFKPLSLRKDFNLNSNNPEHVICGKEMKKKKGIRNGMRLFEFRLFRAIQFPSQNYLLHTKKKSMNGEKESRNWIEYNKLWKLILLSYSFNELFRVYYTSLCSLVVRLSPFERRNEEIKTVWSQTKGIQAFLTNYKFEFLTPSTF